MVHRGNLGVFPSWPLSLVDRAAAACKERALNYGRIYACLLVRPVDQFDQLKSPRPNGSGPLPACLARAQVWAADDVAQRAKRIHPPDAPAGVLLTGGFRFSSSNFGSRQTSWQGTNLEVRQLLCFVSQNSNRYTDLENALA